MAFNIRDFENVFIRWVNKGIVNYQSLNEIFLKSPSITGKNDYVSVWGVLKTYYISGTVAVGSVLTAESDPSITTVAYQWYRGNTPISGATSKTYTVQSADVGYQLKVRFTISNSVYYDSTPTTTVIVPTITISGSAVYGQTLTATPSQTIAGLTYQWYRDNTPISGATYQTYVLKSEDVGHRIRVKGTLGSSETYSDYTEIVNLQSVEISGSLRVGNTLTAVTTPSLTSGISYQWYRNGATITGATGRTYTLQESDRTCGITVRATVAVGRYVQTPRSSAVYGWITKTGQSINIPMSDSGNHYEYYGTVVMGVTFRNPVVNFSITASRSGGGTNPVIQVGGDLGIKNNSGSDLGWINKHYVEGGTVMRYSNTLSPSSKTSGDITNIEGNTIACKGWVAAWDDVGTTFTTTINACTFTLTEWQELSNT